MPSCLAADSQNYQELLCIESQEGSVRHVTTALSKGADPNKSCDPHFADRTPLIRAADRGHAEILRHLLAHGGDWTVVDRSGRTPLLHAAVNGYADAAKELLVAGAPADAGTTEGGLTALLSAARKGYWDVLEHLLEFGAAPNQRDASRSTPLMWAAQAGGREAVNVLLERGADPNLVNERRETALLMAATTTKAQHYMRRPSPLMQHADCVQALLAAGAKADRKGPGGLTALMSAARWSNDTAILKHLLDAGAAIDLQDDVGRTALMFATYVNFTDGVKFLVENGASFSAIQNEDGWTAETISMELRHDHIRHLFNVWRYNLDWDESKNPFFKKAEAPPHVRALWENQDNENEL
eukprot:CAMPEP_0114245288 /NCGR_PEP_ID=MMETSP0058-20121206/11809_1 /TAXON_ID=36894 /ORGANISM="Pyramimonas parkeae, CCMP726" /LENGTH=354 /DNA_ID=CAMNT_0001358317 /DNA_START=334 /DNA_END=1398 /DNA_ORIENTATION=-